MLDNVKHKIKDGEYKELIEKIAEIKKQKNRYVKAYYIKTNIYYDGCGCEWVLRHNRGECILKVVSENAEFKYCEIDSDKVYNFLQGNLNGPLIIENKEAESHIIHKLEEL